MSHMQEIDVTNDEAMTIITEHGGYGSVRVYAVIADGHECAGQRVPIKSRVNLTEPRYPIERLYAVANDGMVPIKKA